MQVITPENSRFVRESHILLCVTAVWFVLVLADWYFYFFPLREAPPPPSDNGLDGGDMAYVLSLVLFGWFMYKSIGKWARIFWGVVFMGFVGRIGWHFLQSDFSPQTVQLVGQIKITLDLIFLMVFSILQKKYNFLIFDWFCPPEQSSSPNDMS